MVLGYHKTDLRKLPDKQEDGQTPESIWYKRSWVRTFKNVFDGLIYALLTAGVFGWLWPGR